MALLANFNWHCHNVCRFDYGRFGAGFSWRSLQIWEQSVISSMPFWMVRTFAGSVIVLGQLIWVYNLYRTAKNPIRLGDERPMMNTEHELAPASMTRPAVAS